MIGRKHCNETDVDVVPHVTTRCH